MTPALSFLASDMKLRNDHLKKIKQQFYNSGFYRCLQDPRVQAYFDLSPSFPNTL